MAISILSDKLHFEIVESFPFTFFGIGAGGFQPLRFHRQDACATLR